MDMLIEAAADLGLDRAETTASEEAEKSEEAVISDNSYGSSFKTSTGRSKWFVDGCTYFWAVAEALELAQESIMILDWWLSPEVYLRRPPVLNGQYRLDAMLKAAAERGVQINIIVYREVEVTLTLNSKHTKSVLEELHPNIKVFRHPDHVPSSHDFKAELKESLDHLSILDLGKASDELVTSLYGTAKDVVLFWAHHEKLLIVDQRLAFMGGLDLCFGRWDTNSHPIADVHPGDLDGILFPGQDYNNARVFDFADVQNWNQNKLDRTKSSRMGWSDVALSLDGPIVRDLVSHFVDRWNFIFEDKYSTFDDNKYERLSEPVHLDKEEQEGQRAKIQLVRSCSEWSSGHNPEMSIFNAYVNAIRDAEYFVYIENQFFITATCEEQIPITNRIGSAIVERICRAHQSGEQFKVIVVMPAVPAFAGDLKSDEALGTRAILEFQYSSICRGGHSILETLRQNGIGDPSQYICFYNLRSFDRINVSSTMRDAEASANIDYESARQERDDYLEAALVGDEAEGGLTNEEDLQQQYQTQADEVADNVLDRVSSSYMQDGGSLPEMRWDGDAEDEVNAYVSEELYVHSKLLIADDRIVICGSANLNDRSQLSTRDSEIAVVIHDPTPIDSFMNGQDYTASAFAASLRRFLFRKHTGLLPDQKCDQPDINWMPIDVGGNQYDWGSPSDVLVADPLCAKTQELWNSIARSNTEVFDKAFHPVPSNHVRTWDDYEAFYARHFRLPSGALPTTGDTNNDAVEKVGCAGEEELDAEGPRYDYGHIVRHEFPGGVTEVKEWLGRIRGNLVEMPLEFLADVDDIAKDGLTLNDLTDKLYT